MDQQKFYWETEVTDPVWGINLGVRKVETHPKWQCKGRYCVVHNPSFHHMRNWPTVYRADLGITERTCPHGIGHPDPDDLAYQASLPEPVTGLGTHGCDGCCGGLPPAKSARVPKTPKSAVEVKPVPIVA